MINNYLKFFIFKTMELFTQIRRQIDMILSVESKSGVSSEGGKLIVLKC